MITPLLHRVLLKLDDVEKKTASGIVIPESVTEKERKAIEIGTVVAIGATAFKDFGGNDATLVVGDRVIIARYSGKEVVDGDIKYIVCNDDDILCLTEEI